MTKKKKMIEVYDIEDPYTPLDSKKCFDVIKTADGDLWIPRRDILGLQIRPPLTKGQPDRYVAVLETIKKGIITGIVGWDGGAESIEDWICQDCEE